MIVNEKNAGQKIDYDVSGKKICFDDDLTINLEKRQEDWDVHIDICFDDAGTLVIGAAAGRSYVAEIDIPKREYQEVPNPAAVDIVRTLNEDETMNAPDTISEPLPLNMEKVTLSLWAI